MKNKIKILTILAIGIFLLPTCQKDPDLPYPETSQSVVPNIIKDAGKDQNISVFDLDAFTAAVIVNLYFPDDKPQTMSLMVCMNGDVENTGTVLANITSWPVTVNVTTADLVNWLPKLDDASQLKEGDQFLFYADVVLKNGTYVNGNDTLYSAYGSALSNWPNASLTVTYSVVCPYDQALAVGDYHVISEDWVAEGDLTITADPDDETIVYVSGLYAIEGGNEDLGPLVMHIDPATYAVTADKTVIASDYWGYTNGAFEGTGTYNSCDGSYVMKYAISVEEGDFGTFTFVFTRN